MFRTILALLALALLTGLVPAADPDPRSLKGVFGQPQSHGELIQKGFLGLYTGRTNLHFGQPMRVYLFDVSASDNGPHVNPRLDWNATLELTDAAGKAVPFRREGGGSLSGNGLSRASFTLWPTNDHAAGVYWKPGTYKLRFTFVNSDEQPPAIKIIPGTFRSNELAFTVREPGIPLDTWDGKGKLRSDDEGNAVTGDDMFLYIAGLDDESSERLRKKTKKGGLEAGAWKQTPWRVAAAEFAPVTVPQDRKLTDAEVEKLIADLKDKDPAVRVRAVRSVPPTAPAEVFAAAAKLLTDQYEQGPVPFSPSPTYPLVHIAAEALCRLGTPAVEPLIAFAEVKGHKVTQFQYPPRWQVAAMLGTIGPNDTAEKYLRAAIQSGDDDRVGAALVAAKAWGKGGVGLTRAILALPKLPDETRRSVIDSLGQSGDLKTDGPTLRKLLASTELMLQQSAISALLALRDTASLLEFERLARDVKADPRARLPAAHATLSLADAKTGDRLVLALIGQKDDVNLRYEALCQVGRRKMIAALPLVLDALDDAEEPTRLAADRVLRELTDNPDGVGYDGKKPNAKLWRD